MSEPSLYHNNDVITEEVLRSFLYGHATELTDVTKPETVHVPVPRQVTVAPSHLPGCTNGVFAVTCIKAGTEMGPFVGSIHHIRETDFTLDNTKSWEVFDKQGRVLYYVDGGDHCPASWLSYVQCARTDQEQTLEIVQIGHNIYYRATKDISVGQELLVWYGQTTFMYMGIPGPIPTDKHMPCKPSNDNDKNERHQIDEIDNTSTKMKCVLCRRGFNSRSNLRSHMRIHTLEKPFVCKFCNRRFSQSSTLRNHVRLHTGEKPYRCPICSSSYSQLAGLRAHQRSARHRPNGIAENR